MCSHRLAFTLDRHTLYVTEGEGPVRARGEAVIEIRRGDVVIIAGNEWHWHGTAPGHPIPWDCTDGFYEAYWRRPEVYLDEHVRRGISIWARVGPDAEQRAERSLRDDLASGRWAERNRDLIDLHAPEPGERLLIA
jgi:hypothetical protein